MSTTTVLSTNYFPFFFALKLYDLRILKVRIG